MGGMSNPWPAFETYTWTGNKEIAAALTSCSQGRRRRDSSQCLEPLPPDARLEPGAGGQRSRRAFPGKHDAVGDGLPVDGQPRFLDATLGWHDLLERDAMQPSGVPVADEFYGPTGAFRGTETCDVAGYLWSQIVLLTVSGQGRMADRAERAFFNAGPATVSRDFKTHVYFQSPNRIVDNRPPSRTGRRPQGHLPADALPAVLHGRAEPHRAQLRDAHVDGHVRQRAGRHALRPLQGLGPGGRSRAGRDRLPDRLPVQRDHRDEREAGAGGDLPALVPHSRLVPESRAGVNGSAVAVEPNTRGFVRVSGFGSRATRSGCGSR